MKSFNPDEPLEFSLVADIKQEKVYSQDRVPESESIKEEELNLPTKKEMASNLLKSFKRASGALVKGEKLSVTKDIAEKRLEVCYTCPKYIKDQNRCSLCGCYLKAKARMATETCPIGKW